MYILVVLEHELFYTGVIYLVIVYIIYILNLNIATHYKQFLYYRTEVINHINVVAAHTMSSHALSSQIIIFLNIAWCLSQGSFHFLIFR